MGVQSSGLCRRPRQGTGRWRDYGRGLLGLQRVDKSAVDAGLPHGRPQAAHHRRCDGGEGIEFSAGKSPTPRRSTPRSASRAGRGVRVARGSRALGDERRVADLIVLNDPVGNRLEIFHGGEIASDPFSPGRCISGFRTGPLGLGHVVFHVELSEDSKSYRFIVTPSASASPIIFTSPSRSISARQSAPP